jgi:putative N-acetylmannosamine-6-phosphate epimerase/predicted NBD/HSP70 family sugar kinase
VQLADFLQPVAEAPLVASVQASPGPLESPEALLPLAQASLENGAKVLRLQGVEAINTIGKATGAMVIGLIKREYSGSEVYITPTRHEVQELLKTPAKVIALDATTRPRPHGEKLEDLIRTVHEGGRLVMADCDSLETARHAVEAGADVVSTTLSGYTAESRKMSGPDLKFLRNACQKLAVPVFAEGRYAEPWQAEAALRIGAVGVIIGGALNDPVKQTIRFAARMKRPREPIGAFDFGGTWMRFGLFSSDFQLLGSERETLAESPEARLHFIRERIDRLKISHIGVSSGGSIDPLNGRVWESKEIMPGNEGIQYRFSGTETFALNDGLATAWGHACLPAYAGLRVATLALGTGVGCGFVANQEILMNHRGGYPRINDLPGIPGRTIEESLGGAALGDNPSEIARLQAFDAAKTAIKVLEDILFPDVVVICGGVGLSNWMREEIRNWTSPRKTKIHLSPHGADAGLYGAASLALFPPQQFYGRSR